jgi:glycine dehydrogenase subunit 2
MDYGFHPPTIYFPLPHVTGGAGALMIEPTETETPETLDEFIAAMESIWKEAHEQADLVRSAPHTTPLARLDETRAARRPKLRWTRETPNP